MTTNFKLKVGAGTTVIAAILTGILANGEMRDVGRDLAAKDQSRVPQATEVMPVTIGKEPLVSPAFDTGRGSTIVEKVPAR